MENHYPKWLGLGAQLLLIVLLVAGLRHWQQRDLVSGDAPAFVLEDMHGTPVSIADYRGEPLLIHFWATWCGICRAEQNAIANISRDWQVLTVAVQSGDTHNVRAYLHENKLGFRVIVDEDGALMSRFGVRAVPASFILDGKGGIRFREVGYTTGPGIRTRLWLAQLS
ncbi:MAG: protein disulfide oxidoreductase [Pseudomonadota bacterium]|nr:protein disulfide oxidoreductase [Pseudomonadota bacterium]